MMPTIRLYTEEDFPVLCAIFFYAVNGLPTFVWKKCGTGTVDSRGRDPAACNRRIIAYLAGMAFSSSVSSVQY